MVRVVLALLFFVSSAAWAANFKVGDMPPVVKLSGDDGETVKDGKPWDSSAHKGKLHMVLYVDPDDADLNEAWAERLKKEEFAPEQFASIAVINMAATWKPNMIISSVLSGKQEKFPRTLYVKDYKSVLVKQWGLQDNAYNVLLFSKDGKLLLEKVGKFSDSETEDFVKLVKANL